MLLCFKNLKELLTFIFMKFYINFIFLFIYVNDWIMYFCHKGLFQVVPVQQCN